MGKLCVDRHSPTIVTVERLFFERLDNFMFEESEQMVQQWLQNIYSNKDGATVTREEIKSLKISERLDNMSLK